MAEIIGYVPCPKCGDRASVQQNRKQGAHLANRCDRCGFDQSAGQWVQEYLWFNTQWLGAPPQRRPANVGEVPRMWQPAGGQAQPEPLGQQQPEPAAAEPAEPAPANAAGGTRETFAGPDFDPAEAAEGEEVEQTEAPKGGGGGLLALGLTVVAAVGGAVCTVIASNSQQQ